MYTNLKGCEKVSGYYESNKDLAIVKIKKLYDEYDKAIGYNSDINLKVVDLTKKVDKIFYNLITKYTEYQSNENAIMLTDDHLMYVSSESHEETMFWYRIVKKDEYLRLTKKLYDDIEKIVTEFMEIFKKESKRKFVSYFEISTILSYYFKHDQYIIDAYEDAFDCEKFESFWKLQ